MAIASLVLGIVSVVLSVFGGSLIGLPVGIVGVIMGVLAKKKTPENGMATAGLVCSIIGTAVSGLVFVACVGCASCYGTAINGAVSSLY
ncbi:MAG: DUF4190 domain-containing protein [Clostridia bacterium]|nr:DUF4190 domain-containing protein [Clostridia bacterium]